MGVNLYMVFERPIAGFNSNESDRIWLARLTDKLAAAAKETGVTPLESFYSYTPEELRPPMENEEMYEQAKAKMPPTEYFDPVQGLAAVRALRAHLADHPQPFTDRRGADHTADVLEELDDCEKLLAAAVAEQVKFRFFIAD